MQSAIAGDSRVLREATTLAEAGYTVHIVGRDVPDGCVVAPGVSVTSARKSRGMRPASTALSPSTATGIRRRVARTGRWLLLPEHRDRTERAWRTEARLLALQAGPFDVVHSHDFNTLELGVELADVWRVPLIYDSHEFWTGRPQVGRPTPLRNRMVARAEGRLCRAATVVITVGDGLARALGDAYGLERVAVVRNTFPLLEPPRVPDAPTGLVYAGRLAADRELEVIAAASRQLELPVTLIGPSDPDWLAHFDPGSTTVLPSAPLDTVDRLLAEAGLALVTHSDRWSNHRLAMPNKLFHAARVGIPVVATDVGELAREVRTHRVGTLYRPGDVGHMVDAVRAATTDYPALVKRVAAVREQLSW
ncbi:MAG TPA: glycosyltransferase, partial [Jiangellaceae bacterium]|nr:glycosyltransferase [Jiangellaceae bacterium]